MHNKLTLEMLTETVPKKAILEFLLKIEQGNSFDQEINALIDNHLTPETKDNMTNLEIITFKVNFKNKFIDLYQKEYKEITLDFEDKLNHVYSFKFRLDAISNILDNLCFESILTKEIPKKIEKHKSLYLKLLFSQWF